MSIMNIVIGVICMLVGWVIAWYWGFKQGLLLGYKEGINSAVNKMRELLAERKQDSEKTETNNSVEM